MTTSLSSIPEQNTVDIWQVDTQHVYDNVLALTDILDTTEFERYQSLHHKFKQTYLISHAACREILASYSGILAKDIIYKKNEYGKPELDHEQALKFNMSHSHDMAIIAVSKNTEIGVDLEYVNRKSQWNKIARRFFSQPEINYLFSQPESSQKTLFYQIWTNKEAFIKALGTGLATPLSTFDASSEGIVKTLSSFDTTTTWYTKNLDIAPGYLAAVSQNTQIEKIRYYKYPNPS